MPVHRDFVHHEPPPIIALRSHDSQERMQWIDEANVQSTIIGPAMGEWGLNVIPLPEGRLIICREGGDNVHQSLIRPEHCGYMFNMTGSTIVNGHNIPHHQAVYGAPGGHLCSRLSAGTLWAAYTTTPERTARGLDALEIGSPKLLDGTVTAHAPPRPVIDRIQELLQTALRATERPQMLASVHDRRDLEEALFVASLQTLGHPIGSLRRNARQESIFKQAFEYLEAHDENLTTLALSAQLGVSARSLFYAFEEFAGMSPGRFMRLRRLSRVRRALQEAWEKAETITEVATRCGFFELGRFASQYRAVFGELPRDTLRAATRRF